MHDVYLFGMISSSTVYVLDEAFVYPQPNEYAEIKQSMPSVGGEAANSAIMLSKLGVKTKLDGIWLNQNQAGKVMSLLEPFIIDVSRLTIKPDGGTEEIVIADRTSRTVFGNYAGFHAGKKQWNDPQEIDIQQSRMIALDPYLRDTSLEAAKLCVRNRKPYVTLDCRYDDYMAMHAEAVIISHELRDQAYRKADMQEVFKKYQTNCEGLIIFTFGADELWFARQDQPVRKYKPFKIVPVDTTGAGDSFRAGIVYGLLNTWSDEATIDFASAVAACVCLSAPHALNAPGLDGVLKFMKAPPDPASPAGRLPQGEEQDE
jgi:sugar/nucleoside kinase (ribokinase family)